MSIIGSNLDRVKNILAGKPGDKTKISVGYRRTHVRHKEGEVWEENGKMWTIKDGLKQTITKLDSARENILIPLCCPECSKPLKHDLDKRAWRSTKKCFDCNMIDQTSMQLNGTLTDFTKETYKKNAKAWLEEKREQFKEWIKEQQTTGGFVTQDGKVEDWATGFNQEQLEEQFEKECAVILEQIEKI